LAEEDDSKTFYTIEGLNLSFWTENFQKLMSDWHYMENSYFNKKQRRAEIVNILWNVYFFKGERKGQFD
jgi:hypothetical protein